MTKQVFDWTQTLKKYHGNEKVARELMTIFFEELALAQKSVNRAFKEKNHELLSKTLHQLKGSCGIVGMTTLGTLVKDFYETTHNTQISFTEMTDLLKQFNELVSAVLIYQKDFPKNASS